MKNDRRRRLFRFVALCLSALAGLPAGSASVDDTPRSIPAFRQLRERALGYHGPSADLTNLTEIRFGWFGPTNLADPLTGDVWWSVNQAVREANEPPASPPQSPSPPMPFSLVPRWAVDPWGSGVSQLTRMIYEEQPLALLGSVDSGSTHLAEQIAAKANLPLVSPLVTDKSVTLAGVPWMFSCAPSDAAIARVLVDHALALPNGGTGAVGARVALLAATDHDSRMTAREVLREFLRRGRSPDFRFDAPAGGADVARQLAALEAARPTAILIVAGPEDTARWVLAIRAAGRGAEPLATASAGGSTGSGGDDRFAKVAGPLLFGTHVMGRTRFLQLAGPAAEGVRFPLLFAPEPTAATAVGFVEAFTRIRGHAPDYAAAFAYDAARLLVEAVRRAGPNRARLREALVQLSPWSGLAGRVDFDGTGQNTRTNLGMGTIRNGVLLPLPRPDTAVQHTAQR